MISQEEWDRMKTKEHIKLMRGLLEELQLKFALGTMEGVIEMPLMKADLKRSIAYVEKYVGGFE